MNEELENRLKKMIDYCEKLGISYTVNRNPSPEEVDKIKASIKRSEDLKKFFVERYKDEG